MEKTIFIMLCAVSSMVFAEANVEEASVEEGSGLYSEKGCIGCHGPAGVSSNPAMFPTTAGLDKAYIVEQLTAFKTYKRRNAMMNGMAAALSEDEINKLASYLAAQKK